MNILLQRFFGAMVLAAGALIIALCGLCTGFFEWNYITQVRAGRMHGLPDLLANAGIPLVVAAVPIAVGVFLVWAGWKMLRMPPDANSFE